MYIITFNIYICNLVCRNCANYKPLLYKYLFSSVQLLVYSVLSHHEFHAISITAISELLQCNLLSALVFPSQCLFLFVLLEPNSTLSAHTEVMPHMSRAIGKKTMNKIIFNIDHFPSFMGVGSLIYKFHQICMLYSPILATLGSLQRSFLDIGIQGTLCYL